jgi:osmotically-inducible protein OsmY
MRSITTINENILVSLLTIIATTSLSGCAAAVIGGGTAATAYVTDPRSSSQISKDHDVKSAVKDALDSILPKNNIEVTSYNNKTLLTGQVVSQTNKDLATKTAMNTAKKMYNSTHVLNYIKVGDADKSRYVNDAYITSKIKTTAFSTVGIDSNHMKVVTSDSIVYLFGTMTKSQAEQIIHISKSTSDVKKVVSLFDYVNKSYTSK